MSPTTRTRTATLNKESYQSEIKQAFQVFDEERTGELSINSLKLLIRSLGFKITRQQTIQQVHDYRTRTLKEPFDYNGIDIGGVLEILGPKYNESQRNHPIVEQKMNFRLFDVDQKGFITITDLKRVVNDLNLHWEEMGLDHPIDLGDDQLKAMIDDFDGNLDGMIREEDFGKIMSMSASASSSS